MRLTSKDLKLIGAIRAARRREKIIHALLLVWALGCGAMVFLEILPLNLFAYIMLATVFVAIFLPRGSLDLEQLADLLDRIEAGSDLPERDELIDALSRK